LARRWYQVSARAYWEEHVPIKEGAEDEREQRKNRTVLIDAVKEERLGKNACLMIAKIAELPSARKGGLTTIRTYRSKKKRTRESRLDVLEAIKLATKRQPRKTGVWQAPHISMGLRRPGPIDPVSIGAIAEPRCGINRGQTLAILRLLRLQVRNRPGLNEFWAIEKSAALQSKKRSEGGRKRPTAHPGRSGYERDKAIDGENSSSRWSGAATR